MNELIAELVKQLGVSNQQAQGGAGLLFKVAQEQLGGDFQQIASKLGGVQDLIKSAPASGGGLTGMLGGLAKAAGAGGLGNLAQLAGGFSQLKLDSAMVGKFVPIVLNFVQSKAGQQAMSLLAGVLKGK